MRTAIGVIACIVFLIIAFVVWLASGRSWLVWGLLLIPSWICGDYLSDKLFSPTRGRSISEKDFSVLRVIYGVVVGGLLIGGMYGIGGLFTSGSSDESRDLPSCDIKVLPQVCLYLTRRSSKHFVIQLQIVPHLFQRKDVRCARQPLSGLKRKFDPIHFSPVAEIKLGLYRTT